MYFLKKYSILILFPFFLLVSCGEKIYEITVPQEIFNSVKEQGVFNDKITLEKYPCGTSYEVFSYKKVHIEIVSSEIDSLEKPPYKKAFKAGNISFITKKSPVEKGYKNVHAIEIERRPLFPCFKFDENCPKSVKQSEISEEMLYEITDIPQNYISLPILIENNSEPIYADNQNYPLYNSDYLDFNFDLINNKEKKSKWDIIAQEYLNKKLLNEVFLSKIKQYENPVKITFVTAVGDMMLGRGVQDAFFNSEKADSVFTDTLPILLNNDFTIGNLECVVTTRELKTKKTYNFKISEKALPYLAKAGFDYLMMTNNHSYDYGEEGFKDTLKAVKNNGFATSGAGLDKTEALDFYRTTLNGQKYSILSVAAYPVENSGFNGEKQATATEKRAGVIWKSPEVIELVQKEKETGAVIIINSHAGSEYVTKPNSVQESFYKELCDAGADVIFGSHPHVLQPIEMYNNSLIVWSLGNFIFPGMDEMYGATDTMLVRTGFYNNKLIYYEKYPATIKNTKVVLK